MRSVATILAAVLLGMCIAVVIGGWDVTTSHRTRLRLVAFSLFGILAVYRTLWGIWEHVTLSWREWTAVVFYIVGIFAFGLLWLHLHRIRRTRKPRRKVKTAK